MKSTYRLMTDSCCDLPSKIVMNSGIEVFDLSVDKELSIPAAEKKNRKVDVPEFYRDLRTGMLAFTSAVKESTFYEKMRTSLTAGNDILYIGFASVLSSTYRHACNVADKLKDEFPERRICCIDSKSASMGEGLLVYYALQMMKAGKAITEVAEEIQRLIPHVCHWFTVDNTRLLKHGGRISATMGAGRPIMHMKPVLHVDDEGHLVSVEKVRGRNAVIREMFDKLKLGAQDIESQTVMISHGDCYDDAVKLADMIKMQCRPKEIIINTVNPVIGAHSGPGTLALFFIGDKR